MFGRDAVDLLTIERVFHRRSNPSHLSVVRRAEWGVRCDVDANAGAEFDHLLLLEVRVDFNLVHRRWDTKQARFKLQ